MLPLYIKVKNFMSYILETVNLDQFSNKSIIAIIGNNGFGKSSIIDMITTRTREISGRASQYLLVPQCTPSNSRLGSW